LFFELQDLKKRPPRPDEVFNLVLNPQKLKENPHLKETIQKLRDFASGDSNKEKKAAFELVELLQVFCCVFFSWY
jgi:DNA repair ATPase RecN